MGAVIAALAGSEGDTGLDLGAVNRLSVFWEQVRGDRGALPPQTRPLHPLL